ncbi:MAG: rane protein, partial [Deltaproteobacteria bacterium]|nr:rane protein [Deltaproteobacteria bacterium]
MSQLVAVEFHDEHTAFAVRAEPAKMQKEYLIDMKDVVVVTKDEKGKVKLHQAANLTMAGAVSGSFWGMLMGL